MSELHTASRLAKNEDVIACALCRRQPDGSAQIIELHGDNRYGAFFLPALNIHVLITDERTESNFGNLFLRSMRMGNYFLMTLMEKGVPFSKSVTRSMSKVLKHYMEVDKQFNVAEVPLGRGHLDVTPTYNGGLPNPPEEEVVPYVAPIHPTTTMPVDLPEPTEDSKHDMHHPDSTAAMAPPTESYTPSWGRSFV